MLRTLLLSAYFAHAQPVPDADPGVVMSPGLATEDGPGALWVNPSQLAYDPDLRAGGWLRYAHDSPTRWSGALAIAGSGFSGGARMLRSVDGLTDISMDLATGIPLPKRLAVGGAMRWHLLGQRQNIVAFDASLSWRPLSWFGMTVLTRSIGNPGGADVAVPQTGAGLAFRPVGRTLTFGLDYLHTFRGDRGRSFQWTGPLATDHFRFSVRARPARGWFVRAHVDSQLTFGLGIEAFFRGVGLGIGADGGSPDRVPDAVLFIGTDERDEHAAPPRRQVPDLKITTTPPYRPPPSLLGPPERSWWDVLEQFDLAERDRTIRGLLLTIGEADLGAARWSELRQAVQRLKTSGKEVVVYLNGQPGDGALLVASAASRIYIHPSSTLRLTGPSISRLHLGGPLEALGVGVQVARSGPYKTAGEIWTEREPTDADREQSVAILEVQRGQLVSALSEGRNRTRPDVEAWIDNGPWTAAEAESLGIVDQRAYPDQVRADLPELLGGKVTRIDLDRRPRVRSPWDAPDQIAVVYVHGPIVSRPSPLGQVAGMPQADAGKIEQELLRTTRSPDVRAVVLRVDSPGGSTLASDQIWRAIQRVKASGRPVVVSMGDLAASGGYYIASGADAIWAEPTTLTGSIGVIAVRPDVSGLLDRLGVQATTWTGGRQASFDDLTQAPTPQQMARLQAIVDDGYERFLDRVARGRGLSVDATRALAEGRVWTGKDAHERGLVDHLGGLTSAVLHARALAGIGPRKPVEVVSMEDRRQRLAKLLSSLVRPGVPRTGPVLQVAPPGVAALWWLAEGPREIAWMIDPSLLPEVVR